MILRYWAYASAVINELELRREIHLMGGHIQMGSCYMDITVDEKYLSWLMLKYPELESYQQSQSQLFRELTVKIQ